MAIQIGDKVPEFLGTDQDGKEVKMSDYKGKKVALYFYPKDNTSGCTAEAAYVTAIKPYKRKASRSSE